MTTPVDRLAGRLAESGLVSPDEFRSLHDSIPSDAELTAERIIEQLVLHRKLTPFQAEAVTKTDASPLVLGNYLLLDKLGQGGMGQVFKARHRRMDRLVALKLLAPTLAADPRAVARFQQEVKAAAKLAHPNIVTAHDADEADGTHFLVMEFVDGKDLAATVKQNGPLRVDVALNYVSQAARGLEYAHKQGVVHRDVKPGNLLLASDGTVKILDMGLARIDGVAGAGEEPPAALTHTGQIMGTVDFMAPEQALNTKKADRRSDVYSLGGTLYFLLTGRAMYTGETLMERLLAHREEPIPSLTAARPDISAGLDAVFRRMVAKVPDDRYQSMTEVLAALDGVVRSNDGPTAAGASVPPTQDFTPPPMANVVAPTVAFDTPAPVPQPDQRPPRRRTGVLLAVALVGILALAATVVLRIETPTGTLVVELTGAETEARVRDGKLILTGPDGTVRYTLSPNDRNTKLAAGPYQVRVEGADGLTLDTPEFVLKEGKTVTVRVTAEPDDPDRAAAVWALSLGGIIRIHPWVEIRSVEELPRGPIQVVWVDVANKKRVTDAAVARLGRCAKLRGLALYDTPVTDAGLAGFKGSTSLDEHLNLCDTAVTDAGLANFKECVRLKTLYLKLTKIGDPGLAHFKDCPLTRLHLAQTQVTDAGLAALSRCKGLTEVVLGNTRVTDAGLQHFKDCRELLIINLGGTKVTDDGFILFKGWKELTNVYVDRLGAQLSDVGLAHLRGCKKLTELNLYDSAVTDAGIAWLPELPELTFLVLAKTRVTDAGLASLKGCGKLTFLDVGECNVTAAKVAELHKALPACRVKWNGGVIEPVAAQPAAEPDDPERAAAVWALSVGGQVGIDPGWVTIKSVNDLPRAPFQVRWVDAIGKKQVTDAGVAHLWRCARMTGIVLPDTAVTDAGLAGFKGCTSIGVLNLGGTGVTDAGLANFKDCTHIGMLGLAHTAVTNAGLANFRTCTRLTYLALHDTTIGDAGLAHFKDCHAVTHLILGRTRVTDAGLANFKECRDLTLLSVGGTKVTDAGLAAFGDCKGLTELEVSDTAVTDAGIRYFQNCPNISNVNVGGTRVSDAGFAVIAGWKQLTKVLANNLDGRLSDAGLAQLKGCKKLTELYIEDSLVTDAGIAWLPGLPELTTLVLSKTRVTDAGLPKLHGCVKLTTLNLTGCKVTAAKLAELHKALPKCRIEWNDGVIEPEAGPDKK